MARRKSVTIERWRRMRQGVIRVTLHKKGCYQEGVGRITRKELKELILTNKKQLQIFQDGERVSVKRFQKRCDCGRGYYGFEKICPRCTKLKSGPVSNRKCVVCGECTGVNRFYCQVHFRKADSEDGVYYNAAAIHG